MRCGDKQKIELKRFLKVITAITAVLILTATTSAQEAETGSIAVQNVEVNPDGLFVGDLAEVTLTLYNPNDQSIKVPSIIIDGSGVSASPILDVGYIAPRSSHEVSFTVKAVSPGIHSVEVKVNSKEHSVTSYFTIFVEERLPEISFDRKIRVGEVNDANIVVSSPIKIERVIIEPLFDSEPDRIFIASVEQFAEAQLKFYAGNESYEFRISFYNGNNYHSYVVEVAPDVEESKDVFINISMPYSSVYLYDAVPLTVELTNLRSDAIYSIRIEAESAKGVFSEAAEIAKLEAGESRAVRILYSPHESGEDSLEIRISYEDEFGNVREVVRSLTVKVLDQLAVSVTNVDIEVEVKSSGSSAQPQGPFRPPGASTQSATVEISVSGDVSNNGFGEARNVYVHVDLGNVKKDYFVGNIDPSDVESFSIPATGNERITKVTVEWANELGETFSITKEYQISGGSVTPPQSVAENILLFVGVATVIAAIVGALLWRRRKKRE
jgi:hypothetical protein